ncbi:asialoglycoprotein receptor 1-like [Salminus brasiliensis]|uniref:asialoglycoprotein receptor 1-like n=1 Tax=Salminus brasiliensis TaxID=930266 RepID=UPI003B82DFBC
MGKCYYFSTDKETWTASRDACVAVGGHLVIITTPEEKNFIKRSTSPSPLNYYWIGLTDAVKEGDWRWLDGTELSTTSKYWGEKQPDDWRGENKEYLEGEDCGVMHLVTDDYVLSDAACNVENFRFKRVCEAKAPV